MRLTISRSCSVARWPYRSGWLSLAVYAVLAAACCPPAPPGASAQRALDEDRFAWEVQYWEWYAQSARPGSPPPKAAQLIASARFQPLPAAKTTVRVKMAGGVFVASLSPDEPVFLVEGPELRAAVCYTAPSAVGAHPAPVRLSGSIATSGMPPGVPRMAAELVEGKGPVHVRAVYLVKQALVRPKKGAERGDKPAKRQR